MHYVVEALDVGARKMVTFRVDVPESTPERDEIMIECKRYGFLMPHAAHEVRKAEDWDHPMIGEMYELQDEDPQ
jgi:hypothetical protein